MRHLQPAWRPDGETPPCPHRAQATKAEFHKMPPQIAEPGKAKTWITRGGNFAVAVSEVEPGAVLDARRTIPKSTWSSFRRTARR